MIQVTQGNLKPGPFWLPRRAKHAHRVDADNVSIKDGHGVRPAKNVPAPGRFEFPAY